MNSTIVTDRQTDRSLSIDIAKGIGISLMVIGHSSAPAAIHNFIYTFHMPLFFIIAGYLMNYEKWRNKFRFFVKRRLERMILPYFFMSICVFYPLWYFAVIGFSKYKTHDIADPLNVFADIFYATFVGDGMSFNAPLWFLPCLFVSELIFFGVLSISKQTYFRCAIVCFLAIIGYLIKWMNLPWSIDIALVVQVFLLFGYIIKNFNFSRKYLIVFIPVLLFINSMNGIDISHRLYGNIFYCYIGGIVGTLCMLLISDMLCDYKKSFMTWLSYLGKESMAILMWHGWLLKILSIILAYLLHISFDETKKVYWGIIVIGAIIISLLILMIKNKIQGRLKSPLLSKCISW